MSIASRGSSNHRSSPSPSSFTTRAAVGQRGADHLLLTFEQRERHVVAVLVGERREADDVGEDDGAVLGHQALDTRIAPLTLATAISQSSPGVQLAVDAAR